MQALPLIGQAASGRFFNLPGPRCFPVSKVKGQNTCTSQGVVRAKRGKTQKVPLSGPHGGWCMRRLTVVLMFPLDRVPGCGAHANPVPTSGS